MTPGCRQTGLRAPAATTAQDPPHGQTQLLRQVVSLIESTPELAPRVQRHRHDGVGILEQVDAGLSHHHAKRRRERAPALVLERVNDRPQRAFVAAGAPRCRERMGPAPAADAQR
jgi:hypothetical protein